MAMRIKKGNKLLIILLLAVAVFGIKAITLDNEDFLVLMAGGFDSPSKPYFFCLNRIYRLSEKKDLKDKFTNYILQGKKKIYHNLYTRILGIIGEAENTEYLMKPYVQFQHDPNSRSRIYHIIDSMGFSGNTDYVPILEALLNKYKEHNPAVTKYQIARSFYLLTGNRYRVEQELIYLSSELIDARNVISSSKGRKRTYEEMMILEKVIRPPNWS